MHNEVISGSMQVDCKEAGTYVSIEVGSTVGISVGISVGI